MNNSAKTDDIIFNFFQQICDEKDDQKCIELGNSWIEEKEKNLFGRCTVLYRRC